MEQERNTTETNLPEQTFQTGNTEPAKSGNGILALLLSLVILLCGVTSALSIMNIRMFWELNAPESAPSQLSLSFTRDLESTAPATRTTEPAAETTFPQLQLVLDTVPAPSLAAPPEDPDAASSPEQTLPPAEDFPADVLRKALQPAMAQVHWGQEAQTLPALVISPDGYLLTSSAVDGTADIRVLLSDGSTLDARFIGEDALMDLAVLRVEGQGLTPVSFCDSESLRPGDVLGAMPSGTATQVSILLPGVLHTSTPTPAGEALVNRYGQVAGISIGAANLAVPSATVKEVAERLIREYAPEEEPSLGLIGEAIPLFYQLYYELPNGFYITDVDGASDAFLKGITTGDILVSINGQALSDLAELSDAVQSFQPGDTVSVVVFRNGTHYELNITLGEKYD